MTREFSDEQFIKLQTELKKTAAKELLPHLKLNEELTHIRNALYALSDYVRNNPFEDVKKEIDFHKHIYPAFRCLHIYHVEVHDLINGIPYGDKRMMRRYYSSRLELVTTDIGRHTLHHQYFKLKATELDELYFTAQEDRFSVLLPVLSEADGAHTTAMGYLSARFKAYELLSHYILMKLEELEPTLPGRPKSTFKWTGETINLIELAYGVHLNNQVNEGKLGIVEFFKGLGDFFGVDLGIPKNGFKDIKKRKRFSKTHFIDRMQHKILEKIDEEDAWRPD
ncbi:MAG TPA: hypothetical protein ENO28_04825 [Bacteroidetes bacterium]|nr:hypothetical protein [Bacteroidota bacterium]